MNKKQHQREVREQKQAAAERKAAGVRWALWGGGVLLLAVVFFAIIRSFTAAPPSVSEVVASDHMKGNPNAELTLVEYSDFQCPACRVQYQSIKEIWTPIKSSVRFVYRHFPLTNTHPHAMTAAYYTEAAAKQGKFWEMHDLLFDNQPKWASKKQVTETFDGYVKQLGLDPQQFAADLTSDAVKQKVASDLQSAKKAQAASTPSLYLNGRLLQNVRTAENLKAAIRQAKAKSE